MDSIIQTINNNLNDIITEEIPPLIQIHLQNFCSHASQKFNIPEDEIINAWNEAGDVKITAKNKSTATLLTSNGIKKSVNFTNNMSNGNDEETKGCLFVITRGPQKGCLCGKKISERSDSGKFCSSHIKSEPKEGASPVNNVPQNNNNASGLTCIFEITRGANKGNLCGKKVSDNSITKKYCSSHVKSAEKQGEDGNNNQISNHLASNIVQPAEVKKITLKLKKTPSGILYEESHRIVFNANKKGSGKLADDGETILPMSAEDIAWAQSMHYPIAPEVNQDLNLDME